MVAGVANESAFVPVTGGRCVCGRRAGRAGGSAGVGVMRVDATTAAEKEASRTARPAEAQAAKGRASQGGYRASVTAATAVTSIGSRIDAHGAAACSVRGGAAGRALVLGASPVSDRRRRTQRRGLGATNRTAATVLRGPEVGLAAVGLVPVAVSEASGTRAHVGGNVVPLVGVDRRVELVVEGTGVGYGDVERAGQVRASVGLGG